jgi:hypothetical protein
MTIKNNNGMQVLAQGVHIDKSDYERLRIPQSPPNQGSYRFPPYLADRMPPPSGQLFIGAWREADFLARAGGWRIRLVFSGLGGGFFEFHQSFVAFFRGQAFFQDQRGHLNRSLRFHPCVI